jgi:hypothetical protein
MNDYSEIAYGEMLFRDIFYSDSDASKLSRKILNSIDSGLHDRLAQAFEANAPKRRNFTYLISISEHGPYEIKPGMLPHQGEEKYGRLSMWRAYGNGKVGVALVFNAAPMLSPSDALNAYTSPVFYCEQSDFDHRFSSLLLRAERHLKALKKLPDRWFESNLMRYIDIISLSLKHPGFSEEREWRITYSAEPDDEHVSDMEFNAQSRLKRQFTTINGIPQRIYKIPLRDYPEEDLRGVEISALIEKVIIGPTQYPVLIADAVIMALKNAGIVDAERRVTISNIPLRT